jgi:hypothetical protein
VGIIFYREKGSESFGASEHFGSALIPFYILENDGHKYASLLNSESGVFIYIVNRD